MKGGRGGGMRTGRWYTREGGRRKNTKKAQDVYNGKIWKDDKKGQCHEKVYLRFFDE